ncbi:MAG: TadE/TadG family type IV pilus assembly protein [Parvularculaceae bacterium]
MSRARAVLFGGRDCASALIFTALVRKFAENRDGNIAILFSFMFAVLLLFTGGAVDYTRYNAVRADLIESMDAAGLAIAQIDALNGPEIRDLAGDAREAYLKEQGQKFFAENFQHGGAVNELSVDFEITTATITPRATGHIRTLFLHVGENLLHQMAGTETGNLVNLDLTTDTEITRRGSGKIELALVLDVTGSMAEDEDGNSTSDPEEQKIYGLRLAVDNLLQVMFGDANSSDNLKIGIVPFNAFVNPGGAASWQAAWGDAAADSYYHGAHFLHVNETGTVDTSASATSINASGIAKVIDVSQKVNHYTLYQSHANIEWEGCVEARPFPLDEIDTAPGEASSTGVIDAALDVPAGLTSPSGDFEQRSRDAYDRMPTPPLSSSALASIDNSRFVPLFHPDEPDCVNGACAWNGVLKTSYMLGSTTRNITIPQATERWIDDPDASGVVDVDGNGIDEAAYGNRSFIGDQYFSKNTSSNKSSNRLQRYLEVVLGFRMAAGNTYANLDSYWDGVKTRLEAMGLRTCSSTSTCNDRRNKYEFIMRNAYVGWWDAALGRYTGKYDQSPSVDEDFDGGVFTGSDRGPNQNCPAPILPLTDDREAIEAHMELLEPQGNTDSANGAIWGMRMLSPQAPFTEGVSYDDVDWSKAIVLMTDGENTAGDDNTHWLSAMTSYGFAIEERMGVGVDAPTKGSSGFQSDRMADQIDEKLLRICQRAKDEGILIYTIIFGLDDDDTEEVFKACATEPVAPYYYKAPSAEELEAAFGDIAQDLVKLHVSR